MDTRPPERSRIKIPEGITLGRTVAFIPAIFSGFSHSGFVRSCNESYIWLNRGDPVGTYSIDVDRIDIPIVRWFVESRTEKVSIPSPVCGLLLGSSYDFSSSSSLTAVLVPDDEPPAENGRFMFAELTDLLLRNKKYFFRPSRYWTQDAWKPEQFEDLIEKQLQRECVYGDALPRFGPYLDERRINFPHLRPYLKHLR